MMLPDVGEAWGVVFSQFRGAKTYIPKNFYTKVLFIALRVEKFGGRAPPPAPRKLRSCCWMLICLIPKRWSFGFVEVIMLLLLLIVEACNCSR
ncbi:hypothetical protein HanPSC8_Chr11g0454131 [Helianthus annuus]|nr:hypothetical protein HanPSC8_Chr11g0454131 [Helianthus annuus]